MNKTSRILLLCIFMLACCYFTSCKKFLEVEPPRDQLITSVIFSNDSSATAAITGLYSSMMTANSNFADVAITLYAGLSAGEIYNTSPNANADQFFQNALQPSNTILATNLWRRAYAYIYHANAIIESLEKSAAVSLPVKDQLTGEAKVVRSLCYFYLANLFGDVPLPLTVDYNVNAQLPRSSVASVYQQIVADLLSAKELLQPVYPSPGRARPNRFTASALLARVYLFQSNWAGAEAEAAYVISNPAHALQSNLNNAFLAGSTEAIWQLVPVSPSVNTWEGNNFIPSSAAVRPTYAATSFLLNAFENGDQRKAAWLKTNTVSAVAYAYPFKYKVRTGNNPLTEYYTVFRLAEQYLIRAEARAQQNNLAGAKADLNLVRTRAGLPNNTSAAIPALLLAIEKERQVELCFEWGHRWLDLKRTARADAVLGVEKTGWKPTAVLYPIPQAELDSNPFLNQNSGY